MRGSILPGKLFFLLPTIKVIVTKVLIQRHQREREKGEWINIHSIYQTCEKAHWMKLRHTMKLNDEIPTLMFIR